MRVVLAFVAAFVTAVNVYLYSRVVDLSAKVRNVKPPAKVVIHEQVKSHDLDQDLAIKLIESTVRVSRIGADGFGTGVVYHSVELGPHSYYHFILTAAHCIDMDYKTAVERFKYRDSRTIEASVTQAVDVLVIDPLMDVAILGLRDPVPFDYVPDLATLEDTKLYQPVYAVGCPLGMTPLVTNGNLSAVYVLGKHLEFTAPIFLGNSGGPLFTATGKLLAIVQMVGHSKDGQRYPHMGFGMPMWVVTELMKDNALGFTVKADDDSSFTQFEALLKERTEREEAERKAREAAKKLEEQELHKTLEEFMKKLKIEDPETAPK